MPETDTPINPISGHTEDRPILERDLDIAVARLEADAEVSREVAIAEIAYNTPVVDRKELWSYYLYYNGDVSVAASLPLRRCI